MLGASRQPSGWATAATVALLVVLSGCVATDSARVASVTPLGQGLEAPLVALQEDQFTLPPPRAGDVLVSDIVYQEEGGDYKLDIRARERYTIVAEETYLDGYGLARPTYHVNATYLDAVNGTEEYWEEYWVDVSTGDAIAYLTGAAGGRQTYRTALGAAGLTLYESQGTMSTSGPTRGNYMYADYLHTVGMHGGFGHGEVLPKKGSLKRFNTAWDHEFELQFAPTNPPVNAGLFNATGVSADAYQVSIKGETKYRVGVEFSAVVTSASPYPLMAHETFTYKSANGSVNWRTHYGFAVTELIRGQATIRLQPDLARDPVAVAGTELTDTFPLGSQDLLTITPAQAKQAALQDPLVAQWFTDNPKAFLSYYDIFWGDLHHIAGALYNNAQEAQWKAFQLAVVFVEFTNPDSGDTAGFSVTAPTLNGQALPPTYQRYGFGSSDTEPNFYTYKKSNWLRNRGSIVEFGKALEWYRDTAGAYSGKKPNYIGWYTWGNTGGGGAGYWIQYSPDASTSDGSFATGTGYYAGSAVHYVFMGFDGIKASQGTLSYKWEQSVSAAGVRLPI